MLATNLVSAQADYKWNDGLGKIFSSIGKSTGRAYQSVTSSPIVKEHKNKIVIGTATVGGLGIFAYFGWWHWVKKPTLKSELSDAESKLKHLHVLRTDAEASEKLCTDTLETLFPSEQIPLGANSFVQQAEAERIRNEKIRKDSVALALQQRARQAWEEKIKHESAVNQTLLKITILSRRLGIKDGATVPPDRTNRMSPDDTRYLMTSIIHSDGTTSTRCYCDPKGHPKNEFEFFL